MIKKTGHVVIYDLTLANGTVNVSKDLDTVLGVQWS